jgi:hypothetical protein
VAGKAVLLFVAFEVEYIRAMRLSPVRIGLTVLYAVACVVVVASWNGSPDLPEAATAVVLVAAPIVAFLVDRAWVLLAVLGALIGRTIGWDSSTNDGNPALWWPYALWISVQFGGLLLVGLVLRDGIDLFRDWTRTRRAG